MAETPSKIIGTVTLDLIARARDTGQGYDIGELEIPIALDVDEIKADLTGALEETREQARSLIAADLTPGRVYFVCANCREFTESADDGRFLIRQDGAVCERCR